MLKQKVVIATGKKEKDLKSAQILRVAITGTKCEQAVQIRMSTEIPKNTKNANLNERRRRRAAPPALPRAPHPRHLRRVRRAAAAGAVLRRGAAARPAQRRGGGRRAQRRGAQRGRWGEAGRCELLKRSAIKSEWMVGNREGRGWRSRGATAAGTGLAATGVFPAAAV